MSPRRTGIGAGGRRATAQPGATPREPTGGELLILGAGKVGTCLARLFASRGILVTLWNECQVSSAEGRVPGVECLVGFKEFPKKRRFRLVLVAVADQAIPEALRLLDEWGVPAGVPALHCSGFAAAAPRNEAGRRTPRRPLGSMHPAFSFPGPDVPLESLVRICFLLDGEELAVAAARGLIEEAGLACAEARGIDRLLYHAGCVTASNLMVVLGLAAGRLFEAAGIRSAASRARLVQSLMSSVLANAARVGFPASATGPAARGDLATIEREAAEVARLTPELQGLFREGNRLLAQLLRGIPLRASRRSRA